MLSTNSLQLPAKYAFVRVLRGSKHLASNSAVHWIAWLSRTSGVTIVGYIFSSAIPVFEDLVSLAGALITALLCFQLMGAMWLYDNWSKGKEERSAGWTLMVIWCIFVIILGSFMTVAGIWGSVTSIIVSYQKTGGSAAWTCADNSV